LAWSFTGAKIRPAELIEGIPQIFLTLGRMLPPDFHKITDAKNYYLPPGLSVTELILPLPLGADRERARRRWWDNTFPQTVIGATLETVQMALAAHLSHDRGLSIGLSCSAQHDTPSVGLFFRAPRF